ncbi:DNA methyltransferase [Chloroflexota bacterium]
MAAKKILVKNHYLHSIPGGTLLSFGVFTGANLVGALTLGVGPAMAYHLVAGATPGDCVTLTRLWLSDSLPKNSESRILGIVLRSLRSHTKTKFIITYSDPSAGHIGTIYQATGWIYTGICVAMPLLDLGDGRHRHSRSVAQLFGTHSVRYLDKHGLSVRLVPQEGKHRYFYFLDRVWRSRLCVPEMDYPKTGGER